jgi:hypothetical protein
MEGVSIDYEEIERKTLDISCHNLFNLLFIDKGNKVFHQAALDKNMDIVLITEWIKSAFDTYTREIAYKSHGTTRSSLIF